MSKSGYYKHPDGEDLVGKMLYCNKITGAIGLGASFVDVQLYNQPKSYLGALGRIAYWTGPALAMSTAFVSVTYISTNLRQKDDGINYALGGATAGSILGTFRKSFALGLGAAVFMALAGWAKKEAVLQGYEFIPASKVQYQSLQTRNLDFSLTPEHKGNWVDGGSDKK